MRLCLFIFLNLCSNFLLFLWNFPHHFQCEIVLALSEASFCIRMSTNYRHLIRCWRLCNIVNGYDKSSKHVEAQKPALCNG